MKKFLGNPRHPFALTLPAIAITLLLFLIGTPVRANLLAYDGFNSLSGATVSGLDGGFGFSDAWSGTAAVTTSSGLSYPGLGTIGSAVSEVPVGNTVSRDFTTAFGAADTTQWLSFLIRQDVAVPGNSNAYGGIALNPATGGDPGLFVGGGFQNNQTLWGLNTAGTSSGSLSNATIVQGQTTLLVVELEYIFGNDVIQLFVDPAFNMIPTVPNAVKTDLNLSPATISIENRDSSWTIDEIRYGDTFFDVVGTSPEPATILLLGTGLLGLLGRRREKCTETLTHCAG